ATDPKSVETMAPILRQKRTSENPSVLGYLSICSTLATFDRFEAGRRATEALGTHGAFWN
ncbi:MAG: hypothetical protein ABI414_14290, partial [Devosia sp.]